MNKRFDIQEYELASPHSTAAFYSSLIPHPLLAARHWSPLRDIFYPFETHRDSFKARHGRKI
jgi:hypothetical protein